MRMSQVPFQTLRESPSGVDLPGHALLLRARFLRDLGAGRLAWLPYGLRTLRKLEERVRRGLLALGGLEVRVPWPGEAGLGKRVSEEPEEPWNDLVLLSLSESRSYRQLPLHVFAMADWAQTQLSSLRGPLHPDVLGTAWAVSVHATDGERDQFLESLRALWGELICGLGLKVAWAVAPSFSRSSEPARVAVLEHPAGEMALAQCPGCGYLAERSLASAGWPEPPPEPLLAPELVATPGASTIADLATFLQLPASKAMKVVFYTVDSQVVCIALRGDLAVDETKVARALGTADFYLSTESELQRIGAVAGYGSPVGLKGAWIWVDPSVMRSRNLVAGANRKGFHLKHVNPGRDFQPNRVVDLAQIREGDPCPRCGEGLRLGMGFGLASVHALDPVRVCKVGRGYLDADGKEVSPAVAIGGMSLGAVVGATAEMGRDDRGLVWPPALAPYHVYLVLLPGKNLEAQAEAEEIYRALTDSGWEVLFDDRNERAGVKFTDADLLGVPVRVTVSPRSLDAGGVEVKLRRSADIQVVPADQLSACLGMLLGCETKV